MSKPRTRHGQGPTEKRAPLTAARLAREAVALLDEGGEAGLSMRRLAERVGVKAASLYNHVANKRELLGMVADAVCAEVMVPAPEAHPRDALELLARDYRRVLLRHRDAARVLALTPPTGANRLALIEAVLEILARAGLDPATALDAGGVLNTYVIGFVLDETLPLDSGDDREESEARVAAAFASLPPTQYPRLRAVPLDTSEEGNDRRFELGLRWFLDGMVSSPSAGRPGSD